LGARENRPIRKVRQQLWARRMEVGNGKGGRLSVTCVAAREVNAPAGTKAVEWRLLTNGTSPRMGRQPN
jgi:hypothetical protein